MLPLLAVFTALLAVAVAARILLDSRKNYPPGEPQRRTVGMLHKAAKISRLLPNTEKGVKTGLYMYCTA